MDNDNANPASLELNYLAPTVTTDGNSIFISNEGDIPTVTFFQVRRQLGQTIQADAVASIRFNNLDDLRNLQKNIDEAITNHQNREQ